MIVLQLYAVIELWMLYSDTVLHLYTRICGYYAVIQFYNYIHLFVDIIQ